MITSVALPYQIYQMTHSNLMVGLLSLVQLVPLLFSALLGGVIADRHNRKPLLLFAESILAMGCLVLAMNAGSSSPSISVMFITAAVMSTLNGLHRPTMEGLTQQMVEQKDFATVGALRSFLFSSCVIFGPMLGGILIATLNVSATYLVDFGSFVISLIAIMLIEKMPTPAQTGSESILGSLMVGIRYAASRQELLGTYFVDFAAMIFGMPQALFPAIASEHGGAKALGFLYAAPAIGSLIVSFGAHLCGRIKRQGVGIAVAAAFWGVSIIFFGIYRHLFWLSLVFLAFAGGFDAISGVFRSTMWNNTIPSHLRGRLAGIEMISYLSGPKLGDTEAGLVAAAFGLSFSIISGGVLCVIGVGVCCYFLPKFWKYKEMPHPEK